MGVVHMPISATFFGPVEITVLSGAFRHIKIRIPNRSIDLNDSHDGAYGVLPNRSWSYLVLNLNNTEHAFTDAMLLFLIQPNEACY